MLIHRGSKRFSTVAFMTSPMFEVGLSPESGLELDLGVGFFELDWGGNGVVRTMLGDYLGVAPGS